MSRLQVEVTEGGPPKDPGRPDERAFLLEFCRALWANINSKEARVWTFLSVFAAAVGLSSVKTEALVARAPRERLLLGSDFPICKEHFGSVAFQENQLRGAGMSWADIERLHANARRLLG